MAFLITFACYGKRQHGDPAGSVDREHNVYGARFLDEDPRRAGGERGRMTQPTYILDGGRRFVVLDAVVEVCDRRGWRLWAAHVRSDHVHVAVSAAGRVEKVMNDFKAYASRALTRAGFEDAARRRWSRHGSTRYLWTPEQLSQAILYTLREQGEAMALYESPDWRQALSEPRA